MTITLISVTNFDIDFESTSYEKMHSKFLKNILNVSKYCRNSAIRGELGRLPLSIKVLSLGVKYWHLNVYEYTILQCSFKMCSSIRTWKTIYMGSEYWLPIEN